MVCFLWVCMWYLECYSMYYITFVYTVDTLRAWAPLTVTIVPVGQSITMFAQYVHYVFSQTTMLKLPLHPSSFNITLPMLSTSCDWWLFEHHTSAYLKNVPILDGILIAFNMILLMNDAHITYCHMNTFWSVGFAWSYFSYPDYLIVQYWIHAVILFPDSVTLQGMNIFILLKTCQGGGHMHEGMPCHHIVAIIDVAYPFVITIFLSPYPINKCHIANNMSGLIKNLCNNWMFLSFWIDIALNDKILSCCLLFFCLFNTYVLILGDFVTLGFHQIISFLFLVTCLLATCYFLPMYHHQHRYVMYVISFCLISSLSGLWLMCPDFICISPFLVTCFICVNLFMVTSYLISFLYLQLQSHSYHHWFPCPVGLVSGLLAHHSGLCLFVCFCLHTTL